MRNKDRITPFLNELGEIWGDKYQDWRFGQLMYNFFSSYGDPFHLEEDEFLVALKAYAKNEDPRKAVSDLREERIKKGSEGFFDDKFRKLMEMEKTSVFLSLVLRHKPEAAGITLDEHGWAEVSELLDGINATGRKIDMEMLEEIVRTDEKGRYSLKTLIRANQGHSAPVDVELKETVPPEVLYHGTATKSLEAIRKEGIKPMNRLYVHLSKDLETATKVGARHGECVILKLNTKKMVEDGVKFYLSENGVWLTKYVDVKYIEGEVNGRA